MPITILMPALSPTMEKGNLAKWLKKEGDAVKAGDIIAEIETDKATMEFEAVDEGTIGKILVPEGTPISPSTQPIAVLLEEGEDKSAIKDAPARPLPARRLPRSRPSRREPCLHRQPRPRLAAPPDRTGPSWRGTACSRSGGCAGAPPPTAPPAASSLRRSPGVWPRKPASTSLRWRAPAHTAAW